MKVTGSQSLRRKLEALRRDLAERVVPELLEDGAEAFAAEMRSQAPVDTGELREAIEVLVAIRRGDTIHASAEAGDASGKIGPIEFGKLGQQPNPFIRRSFASRVRQVKARIASGIAKAVRNAR